MKLLQHWTPLDTDVCAERHTQQNPAEPQLLHDQDCPRQDSVAGGMRLWNYAPGQKKILCLDRMCS